jgi:hypothetical protein
MANIIDYSYFIREINLPQTGNPDGQSTVTNFITLYEKELLQLVLGYDLWKAFTAGLVEVTPAQKWKDLRDGKEFTNLSGKNKKWEGFKNTDLVSPIANYVYYKVMENNATQTTTIGEVSTNKENAASVSPVLKMVNAWNRMVDMICVLKEFLDANTDTYTEWQNTVFNYRLFRKTNQFGI